MRIVSDEHLTGPSQELVQTRLDLWTRTHIERILGPLFVLSVAEDVTGIARGIAFQIVEALGVLERSQVAQDVKSLDQTARAALAQSWCALRRVSSVHPDAAEAGAARRLRRSCGR